MPSAPTVREARKGDCNEHTVLHALARAAGIPTRKHRFGLEPRAGILGVVPARSLCGKMDCHGSDLGEPTVNPAHIKLFTGGIDQWSRLMAYIGAIKIEILPDEQAGRQPPL